MRLACAFSLISSAFLLLFFGSIDRSFCEFCFKILSSIFQRKFLGEVKPIDYESTSILAPCLLTLSEKYFKSKRAMRGSLVIINLVPNPKSFLQRRMLEAVNEDKKHELGIMIKDGRLPHRNASKVTDRAKNYLLLMLVLGDLTDALRQWKSLPTWNPLAQTVIVFMDPIATIENKERDVKIVFDELLSHGILFANVIFQLADDPHKLVTETWFPYLGDSCAKTVDNIYKIDECVVNESVNETTGATKFTKSLNEFNYNLFPKVPNRLHGCPLTVSTFIWEPFVVGNDTVESGLEILMLETMSTQMEMELKFNILSDEISSALISGDNETGIYADLIQK